MIGFIKQLSLFEKIEEYTNWMFKSLTSIYNGNKDPGDFLFFILKNELSSPSEALEVIYERHIPDGKKFLFRQAIGFTMLKFKDLKTAFSFEAINDLVYLMVAIKATEPLGYLLDVLSSPFANDYPDLLYNSIANIKSFEPNDEIFDFISQLTEKPNFDDGYLLEAIKIMTDCWPDNASQIISLFHPRITMLYQEVKNRNKGEEAAYWESAINLFKSKKDKPILKKIIEYSR